MTQYSDLRSQLKGVLSLAKQLASGAEISLALDIVRKLKHLCEKLDLEYLNSLEDSKRIRRRLPNFACYWKKIRTHCFV
jgi:hypothetical protein